MKKGIARPGFIGFISLLTLMCFNVPCFASSVSDLLISEIMANPEALPDTRGEWFELYNPTIEPINLRGLDLGDDGSNRHRFDTDLLILPSAFLTLARSADPGFAPDYIYDNFTLANGDDEIVFRDGLLERLRFEYGPGFAQAGVSRELQQLPMIEPNYGLTLASLSYGSGDLGTPGVAGSLLLAPSAVPLPAATWLFLSGVLTIAFPSFLSKSLATRATPITPVIHVQAGISKWTKIPTRRRMPLPLESEGLQS